MKKIFKIILWSVFSIILILGVLMYGFIYKVKNGFPVSYETEHPNITFPADKKAVLVFSKTTGFRHGASIEASKSIFNDLAKRNNWFLYETEEGGVFNAEQLSKFAVVILNNSTGRVLNDEQQLALEQYVENGGSLLGIHGAGDDSHHWDWYINNLLGSEFSHHAITAELQKTDVHLDNSVDSLINKDLPKTFTHSDEWYVFFENPRKHGFNVVYSINDETINPSGNLSFLVKDKNFGMGKDHPVAWHKVVGKGKTFYTSMGHDETTWQDKVFVKMLENAIQWAIIH